jgi:hypothetical protein
MRPRRGAVLPFTKSADDPTPFTLVGNSADSRRLAQCRDTVYGTPPQPTVLLPLRKSSLASHETARRVDRLLRRDDGLLVQYRVFTSVWSGRPP